MSREVAALCEEQSGVNRYSLKYINEPCTIHADLTFIFQITLVCNNNNGERVLVLDSQNLLVESANFFKRVARGDTVNEKETFSGAHVLLPHGARKHKGKIVSFSQGLELNCDGKGKMG